MSRENLKDLIKRVEKCTGPDRRLADLVLLALGWQTNYELKPLVGQTYVQCANQACWRMPNGSSFESTYSFVRGYDRPDPTESLEDVLTLVRDTRPNTAIHLAKDKDGRWSAEIDEAGNTCFHADTGALALLGALLRALEPELVSNDS
jgi:hypothetical protein